MDIFVLSIVEQVLTRTASPKYEQRAYFQLSMPRADSGMALVIHCAPKGYYKAQCKNQVYHIQEKQVHRDYHS